MAIGDKAVAAGMALVNGATTAAKDIDLEENRTRDYIADEISARKAADDGKVDKPSGGAGVARLEPGSVHNVGFYTVGDSTLYYRPVPTTAQYDRKVITQPELAAALSTIDLSGYATQSQMNGVYGGFLSPDIYNRTISGNYRVAYVGANGVLGWVPSSRRYKKNIKPAAVDPNAVLDLDLVTFLYKVEVDTDRLGELQHGLIAEDVDAAGLDWLVDYGADGQPEGVRYDRLSLAILPVVQKQAADLAALQERVEAIETHLDALGGINA